MTKNKPSTEISERAKELRDKWAIDYDRPKPDYWKKAQKFDDMPFVSNSASGTTDYLISFSDFCASQEAEAIKKAVEKARDEDKRQIINYEDDILETLEDYEEEGQIFRISHKDFCSLLDRIRPKLIFNPEKTKKMLKEIYKEEFAQVKAEGIKEGMEAELSFLESLDIPDLYKQATQERSHYYVGSKCKAILERISYLKQLEKEKEG